MKKYFSLLLFAALFFGPANAQVDNYSLRMDTNGSLNAGYVSEINESDKFTVQFWMHPDVWTPNAAVFTRGNADQLFELRLGSESGRLKLLAGAQSVDIVSVNIAAAKWAHISIVSQPGSLKVYVNNTLTINTNTGVIIPSSGSNLFLGNNFKGRIDEFRIWSEALATNDLLWRNTLNKYHPQWNNLVLYYKFDQNLCPNVVDYTFKHHGTFSAAGAMREKVTDNAAFKYRIQAAYTDFSRFADRGVDREKYLLSNDIIMLGVESNSDGTITMPFPYNEGKLTNAVQMQAFEGRTGVLAFNGAGAGMEVGAKALIPTAKYSLHTWLYIDEWTEGAYLFQKEASVSQGFSVRLGNPATYELILRLNGQEFKRNIPTSLITKPVGSWWNLGVVAFSLDMGVTKTFMFTFDGKGYFPLSSGVPATVPATLLPQGVNQTAAVIGKDFKGKLDETVIWHADLSEAQIKSYMSELPMPGFGKIVEAQTVLYRMNSFWNYDNAENPGYDLYSYKHFMNIVRSAFDGYRGYKIRMSVKGHDGWESTMANATKRKTMAEGIVAAAADFDGIDLDFEWCYDGTCFNNYGLLLEEIGKIMPAEKIFTVSPHYVSYSFPTKYMTHVDYFTFQIYGPSANVFRWNTYVDAYNRFIAQGYPKDKIVMSYATTTSRAYEDAAGNVQTAAAPIGVRNGLLDGTYTPDMDVVMDSNGKYRFITGVNQTRNRSEYIHEKDLAGIMYWDMGNDVATSHPYSIPKASNYALASNVDTVITQVNMNPSAVRPVSAQRAVIKIYPNPATNFIRLSIPANDLIDTVKIFSANGQLMQTFTGEKTQTNMDVKALPGGFYNLRVSTRSGKSLSATFLKQ